MPALHRGRLRLAVLVCAGAACFGLPLAGSAQASPLPEVHQQDSDLVAAGERFQAWGFNYGLRQRYPILRYFDRPTEQRLRQVVADMREARQLGANGVPFFVLDRKYGVSGAQPAEVFTSALKTALENAA
jgi:hypothetical protein